MLYFNWIKVLKIIKENPEAKIVAGLKNDWKNNNFVVYNNGQFFKSDRLQCCSTWDAQVIHLHKPGQNEAEKIYCGTPTATIAESLMPDWWGIPTAVCDITENVIKWAYENGHLKLTHDNPDELFALCSIADISFSLTPDNFWEYTGPEDFLSKKSLSDLAEIILSELQFLDNMRQEAVKTYLLETYNQNQFETLQTEK